MAIEKNNPINEHINRIKFISNYQLNEAKYSLVDNLDEDDVIPDNVFKDPKPISQVDSNVHEDEEEVEDQSMDMEEPEGDDMEVTPETEPQEEEPLGAPDMPEPEPQTPSMEDVQNNILKTSVSAMEKMNNQLNNLESVLNSLNQKIETLNTDVQEVKEPTTVEKLEARKQDSHPYYMNLNDMWNGNAFQARTQINNTDGIIKLDDGTYVADFDSLPKFTPQEIKDSFR